MAREEIIEKLDEFLSSHSPLMEECHIVYLMVEIRKILDHERDHRKNGEFSLLRFYCDWTVHTEKQESLITCVRLWKQFFKMQYLKSRCPR